MAARKRRGAGHNGWDASVRERIKTSMLVNRLHDHVVGKVELAPTQVTAALGLLKKTIPDLAQVKVSGDIEHRYVARLPAPYETADQWEEQQHKLN